MSLRWGVFASLLNNNDPTVSLKSQYLNMEFDVVMTENHTWSATPTNNPVEKGSPVSDHVQRTPDELTISGIISNAPMYGYLGLVSAKNGEASGESAVKTAFDNLYKLIDDRMPMMVYTRYRHYPDMVLTKINIPRKPEDGNSIVFTASFKHVRCVSTLVVDSKDAGINPEKTSSKPVSRQAQPKKSTGKKYPKKPGKESASRNKAIADCLPISRPDYAQVKP